MTQPQNIAFKKRRLQKVEAEREELLAAIAAFDEQHGESLTMPQLAVKIEGTVCHVAVNEPVFSLDAQGAARVARILRIFAIRNGAKVE